MIDKFDKSLTTFALLWSEVDHSNIKVKTSAMTSNIAQGVRDKTLLQSNWKDSN